MDSTYIVQLDYENLTRDLQGKDFPLLPLSVVLLLLPKDPEEVGLLLLLHSHSFTISSIFNCTNRTYLPFPPDDFFI